MRQDGRRRSDDHWNIAAEHGGNGLGASLERNIDQLDSGDSGNLHGWYLESDVGSAVEHAVGFGFCFRDEFRKILHAVPGRYRDKA